MIKKILVTLSISAIFSTSFAQNKIDSLTVDTTLTTTDSTLVDNYDYSLDNLVHDWYFESLIDLECNIDSNSAIYFPDSIYIRRLQTLPHYMEMTYNAEVKRHIERYARYGNHTAYMLGIGEAYYFPMFETALSKLNLPLELKYLPVIESALNARATSPMGAAGLWQFMPRTGKHYGLEINSLVDERRDPLKASDAAAKYLADLYEVYNDWHLVIAAYNCGPGNVAKAIRRADGKRNFWQIYPYLPRETREYVPKFIAANYIMNYYAEHNICPATTKTQGLTDTIMLHDRVHLQQIAEVIAVPLDQLKFLNPQYGLYIVPGEYKAYPLVLPLKNINSYDNNRDSILAYKPELSKREVKVDPAGYCYTGNGKVIYYKVKNGDYLGKIAKKFRVKVSQIKKWNNMRGTFIRAGQKLKIYK